MSRLSLLLPASFMAPSYAATLAEQVAAIQPGTWGRIVAANTAADVAPGKDKAINPRFPLSAAYHGNTGFSSIWIAWNGGAFAANLGTCGTLLYFGGGHMDYRGSEVIGLDLCGPDGTPFWKRFSDPYNPHPNGMTWPLPTGTYPDGSPSPAHTAQSTAYAPDTRELIALVGQLEPTKPTNAHNAWVLNLDSKQWRGPFPHYGSQSASAAWDPVRKQVWFQAFISAPTDKRAFQSFAPSTNTVTKYQNGVDAQLTNGGALMGYDPDADVLVNLSMVLAYRQQQIGERDPAKPGSNWTRDAVASWPTALATSGTMAWSPARHAWIV